MAKTTTFPTRRHGKRRIMQQIATACGTRQLKEIRVIREMMNCDFSKCTNKEFDDAARDAQDHIEDMAR